MDLENNSLENHPEWIPTEEQRDAGITETDLMRENQPPAEEPQTLEECWPVDEYGLKIPMEEWGVSELGMFPDSLKDKLIVELRKNNAPTFVKLLEKMDPSQIAEWPREANAMLENILVEMGMLKLDSEGRIKIPAPEK